MSEASFEQRYRALNDAQRRAVDTIDGPVLVIAGPGSGKTEILSLRVGNILRKTDMAPSNILCLTFTDAAASNMRRRLAGLIGRDAYRVAIHTFHSFALEIIERNPEYFYQGARFLPADTVEQYRVLNLLLEETAHDNPLRSYSTAQGWVYLDPILRLITSLKRAGLAPDEFARILDHNESELARCNAVIGRIFGGTIRKATIDEAAAAIDELAAPSAAPFPVEHFAPLGAVIARTLTDAVETARTLDKTGPLTEWKKRHTRKSDTGDTVLSETVTLPKLRAAAGIYRRYREVMREESYFDFDDMILDTIGALRRYPSLKSELGEQFQYVLVDEFQDTNDAQVRLLRYLTDAAVYEGRPNIMAVGDDDQAIYKFQGAEVGNIINFTSLYRDPEIITMTDNYRSTQDILDVARFVITQGEERLENRLKHVVKELRAANPALASGTVRRTVYPTFVHELHAVARTVRSLLEAGTEPEDIAVIARTHDQLIETARIFSAEKIPVRYERKRNVLEEPHIKQLITMARFITTLARKDIVEADEYLPEILSYPFWRLARRAVWELAVRSDRERNERGEPALWMELMRRSDDGKLNEIAALFDYLSGVSRTETLERALDAMIGSRVSLVPDGEEDEYGDTAPMEEDGVPVSPFREYYFGRERFEEHKAAYLSFLSALRVFVGALREYKHGAPVSLDDLVNFVELHEKNHIALYDASPFVGGSQAVHLLTAHKSKGLEFDTVFVLSCSDDVWVGRGRPALLRPPSNLPILTEPETVDDRLRLFFVAITRAKRNLYLSAHTLDTSGKERYPLRFFDARRVDDDAPPAVRSVVNGEMPPSFDDAAGAEALGAVWDGAHRPPFVSDECALLAALVEDYRMSATHLNNFLDVTRGGPQVFLEQNLLRFPQAKTPSSAYGSAMHRAVELAYIALRKSGEVPPIEDVVAWFRRELMMQRLSRHDERVYGDRGEAALRAYYAARAASFRADDRTEMNFKHQGVIVGSARLNGRIDRIERRDGMVRVVDWKTGAAVRSWRGGDRYEKIKLHKYKQQLIFYKLLVEGSRECADWGSVSEGVLEFLEPVNGEVVVLPYEITREDTERLTDLIDRVYGKITALDFPDVSGYGDTIDDILRFEDDLLEGRV